MIDVQQLQPVQLTDLFRDKVRAETLAEDDAKLPLRREAEQVEEEILRRMAW